MWRKGNPFALLVGIQIGAAIVENLMETKKLRIDLPFDPAIPPLGITKEAQKLIRKNISTPMFIAALFTVSKIWKQPQCPSADEWIEQLWAIYTMEYYSTTKKEENFTLCDSMDGSGDYYAKWNKPAKERQIPHDFTHMWKLMNKLNKQNTDRLRWKAGWQLWGWVRCGEIEQKGKRTHRHGRQCGDCRGWGEEYKKKKY